jgi:hypothetical protein
LSVITPFFSLTAIRVPPLIRSLFRIVAGITICPFELTVAICPILSYLQVRKIVRPKAELTQTGSRN